MPEHQQNEAIVERIEAGDVSLFDCIETQNTSDDRNSLLQLQLAVRRGGPYAYLEVGSHVGGTLQPHVVDPLCIEIISVDARPASQPDQRGKIFDYPENSTARMLESLATVPGANLRKIRTFDSDVSRLTADDIRTRPAYCFIDAEHTDSAVQADFDACFRLLGGVGIFCFHDAWILYQDLSGIIKSLEERGIAFKCLHLPDSVFLIDTSKWISEDSALRECALSGWRGYLWSLGHLGWYREEYLRDHGGLPA